MKQMEDTICTLTNELDKMQEELEKNQSSQRSSAIQHQQTIQQMTVSNTKYLLWVLVPSCTYVLSKMVFPSS